MNCPSRLDSAFLLACVLAGCATATPYQPMQNNVGYADQQLESNRYRVSFAGNSSTKRETVENYVLYRTAEVTLDKGYDYFVLSSTSTEREPERSGGITFGIGGYGFGSRSGVGIGIGTGTSTDSRYREYQGQADALLMRGKKPADNPAAYDAREVKENLESGIVRPPV